MTYVELLIRLLLALVLLNCMALIVLEMAAMQPEYLFTTKHKLFPQFLIMRLRLEGNNRKIKNEPRSMK